MFVTLKHHKLVDAPFETRNRDFRSAAEVLYQTRNTLRACELSLHQTALLRSGGVSCGSSVNADFFFCFIQRYG